MTENKIDVHNVVLDYLKNKWSSKIDIANRKMKNIHEEYCNAMEQARAKTIDNFKGEYDKTLVNNALEYPDGELSFIHSYWVDELDKLKSVINEKYDVDIDHDGDWIGIKFWDSYFEYQGYPDDMEIELNNELYEMVSIIEVVSKAIHSSKGKVE